jgi:beta-lactamase regulating signal transducer with metallopeptidase domain
VIAAPNFAGISSALWAFAAVLGQVAVLIGLLFNRRKVQNVQASVDDTHKLVNGAATRQDKRIDALTDAVHDAGGVVPPIPPYNPEETTQ